MRTLGIDTSNYTTSAAVFDGEGAKTPAVFWRCALVSWACGRAMPCSSM